MSSIVDREEKPIKEQKMVWRITLLVTRDEWLISRVAIDDNDSTWFRARDRSLRTGGSAYYWLRYR